MCLIPNVKPLRVTVTIEDAEISWDDVLDAVRVISDEDHTEAPWEDCDGWEHIAEPASRGEYYGVEFPDRERSIRYVSRSTREGGDVWLVADPKAMGLPSWQSFHAYGASKQVAHELAAEHLRKAYAQLATWYSNGWQYWGVIGELHDCHASVWGVDDYRYANTEVRNEIAHELAHDLEQAGYLIIDRPIDPPPAHSSAYTSYTANRWRHGPGIFNISGR